MKALCFVFSPSGRLPAGPFVAAVAVVYVVGAASSLLTVPAVLAQSGPWPFAAVQAVLIWIWFALHARRLRDAGRGISLAAGVSVVYALGVALLLLLAVSFSATLAGPASDANTASALGLILLVSILAILVGAPHDDLGWLVVAILLAIAYVPVILAIAVTVWAATRASVERRAA